MEFTHNKALFEWDYLVVSRYQSAYTFEYNGESSGIEKHAIENIKIIKVDVLILPF